MATPGDPPPVPAAEMALKPETKEELQYHRWEIGRFPDTVEEWALELRLAECRWEQDFIRLRGAPSWLYGRPSANPDEANEELRLRDLEKRWQVELDDRNHRSELKFAAARQISMGEGIRSWVLLAVVAAVVATPIYAMTVNIDPQSFGQYISPITGIAGTIIGYWFGQRSGQTTVMSPSSALQSEPRPSGSAK
jgi:hypothetical protein